MTKDNKKDKQTIITDTELNALAIKIVSRMVKLKSMEDWFHHVASSQAAWDVAYHDLEMTEEEDALQTTRAGMAEWISENFLSSGK